MPKVDANFYLVRGFVWSGPVGWVGLSCEGSFGDDCWVFRHPSFLSHDLDLLFVGGFGSVMLVLCPVMGVVLV